MFRLYHFTAERPAEDLALGKNHILPGRVGRFLTSFQLDGVRFLYKNFIENKGCILNDESGLGKTAVVAVFLHAILSPDSDKRCLIIVKNEEKVNSWKFHLEVLAKLPTKILHNEKDLETDGVYLITWDVLRKSSSIAHTLFNCVILDDRDELTSNKICMNYFLRNYENKISLIVATADVTLDIKQFHGLLRLSGHLDKKYHKLSVFEQKFSLPKVISGKPEDKNLLEAYFQRREKIINFCRDYRLRRYRHQYEEMLPLVAPSTSAQSLAEWKEQGLTKSSSVSSGSVKIISSSSDKDTEELFQSYFDVKTEKSLNKEVAKINENASKKPAEKESFDTVEMSPLLFESDSEDMLPDLPMRFDKAENLKEKHDKLVENKPTTLMKKETPTNGRKRKSPLIDIEEVRSMRSNQTATRSRTQQRKYLLLDVSTFENKRKRKPKSTDRISETKNLKESKKQNLSESDGKGANKDSSKVSESNTRKGKRKSSVTEVRTTRSKSENRIVANARVMPARKRPKSCELSNPNIRSTRSKVESGETSKSALTKTRSNKKNCNFRKSPTVSQSINVTPSGSKNTATCLNSEVIIPETEATHVSMKNPLAIVSESPMSSSYNFNLDYLNKQLATENINSSDLRILSPQNQVIIITSSNECSNPPSCSTTKRLQQIEKKITSSPDIFDNFDDYDFLCTQKIHKPSSFGFKMFGKGINESQSTQKRKKSQSSCLDSLEKEYRSHKAPIADTEDMNIFEITTNETFGNLFRVKPSGVEISPIKMRTNGFQNNKITKYLIGGEISSQSIESSQSHEISDRRRSNDGYPKTPKKQTISQKASTTTTTTGKRSPKLMGPPQNNGITPTGLTKWLIKPTGSATKSSKRRRLDLWFKD